MSPARLIQALRTPRSDGSNTGPGRSSSLPTDLLRQAARRLGTLALIFMSLALIDLTLGHTVFARLPVGWTRAMDVVALGAALLSLGVFLSTRFSKRDPAFFVTLGLAYEVVLAAALGFLNHRFVLTPEMASTPAISRIALIILIFAAIVPSTPRRTLVAALIAASMDPLMMAFAMRMGRLDVPLSSLFWMHLPNYLSAGVAFFVSRIITSLGSEVRDARELGSYRLGALLGRGGMGEVYVAHHRMLARPAAIKLIRPEVLERRTPERARITVERFRREAETAAHLRSPHTIQLYDFGVADDGAFYYVMELLEGLDLDALIEQHGPLPAERAVHLLLQACESLGEAHALGLMHRDIKPSNIHVCRVGLAVDFVKVLDFGLVKLFAGQEARALSLTPGEIPPGTPAFMAPESVFGTPKPDHRADIYALGCVGYWMLTGELVFVADNAAKMLMQHVEGIPTPPSDRTELDIPPELDAIILSCLAKRRDDRPASAQELAERLAACPLRQRWTPGRAAAWWHEHLPSALDESSGDPTLDLVTHG